MRKKIGFFVVGAVLFASLLMNYAQIRGSNNTQINGGNGGAMFFDYGNQSSLKVDGCLLWKDEKNRSAEMRQYWKIRVINDGRSYLCQLIDATDWKSGVIIGDAEDCEVKAMDAKAKTATIAYKDAMISVNGDSTIWSTTDPNEKGGGELVSCLDKRMNWYPFD